MSSNFQQFDPNLNNLMSDGAYTSSSERQGGVQGGQASSQLFNKFAYQNSAMVYAIGQYLANCGQTASDANVNALITSISNAFGPHTYLPPVWVSASQVTVKAGSYRDSTNTYLINLPSDLTLNITSSGAGGLDTGSKANSTHYYIHVIGVSSTGASSAVFSTSSTIPTFPAGYNIHTTLKMTVFVLNNGNIAAFRVGAGWPMRPKIIYTGLETSNFNIISGGSTGSTWVTVNAIPVPAIARLMDIETSVNGNSVVLNVLYRETGSGGTGLNIASAGPGYSQTSLASDLPLNATQYFDYYTQSGSPPITVLCRGYTVTEI